VSEPANTEHTTYNIQQHVDKLKEKSSIWNMFTFHWHCKFALRS